MFWRRIMGTYTPTALEQYRYIFDIPDHIPDEQIDKYVTCRYGNKVKEVVNLEELNVQTSS